MQVTSVDCWAQGRHRLVAAGVRLRRFGVGIEDWREEG